MISEIHSAMNQISSNDTYRAVVIQAKGNCFSAGADLTYMKSMASFSKEDNQKDSIALFEMFLSIYNCPIPVICLVEGPSFGGANGIIAGADYVMATNNSVFSFSEVNLGIIPATISPFVIAKIGIAKSTDLFLSGRRFTAEEAIEIGLVNTIVQDSSEEEDLSIYISYILSSAPKAVRTTKELLRSFAPLKPAEYKQQTSRLIAEARVGEEGRCKDHENFISNGNSKCSDLCLR